MPSSPKIPKEVILQNALEMLIEKGYSEISITALAKKIGCSTQPISWHFGNMENFRNALTEYAMNYANSKMTPESEAMDGFSAIGQAYVNLAFDEPNLFKYLFMTGESGFVGGGIDFLTEEEENAQLIAQLAKEKNCSLEQIKEAFTNTLIYTHGLACFIAGGVLKISKEEIKKMVEKAGDGYFNF